MSETVAPTEQPRSYPHNEVVDNETREAYEVAARNLGNVSIRPLIEAGGTWKTGTQTEAIEPGHTLVEVSGGDDKGDKSAFYDEVRTVRAQREAEAGDKEQSA